MSSISDFVSKNPALASALRRGLFKTPKARNHLFRLIGRLSLLTLKSFVKGEQTFNVDKKTVILCIHEASFTGAPILAWNLARLLQVRFNVVCVFLEPGSLVPLFRPHCVGLIGPRFGSLINVDPAQFARKIFGDIARRYGNAVLIANSAMCEVAVTAARAYGISTVSLVHEFAEYLDIDRLKRLIEHSDLVIFSSRLLASSAERKAGIDLPDAIIVPQGKSIIPEYASADDLSGSASSAETTLASQEQFLCISCGHVQVRKGVDIFIAVAIDVLRRGIDARFVWIGDGYDPVNDLRLGVWLKDQIDRSGQAERISIVPALSGSQLESAYRRADLMFLSSRLDPLPNVAIDSMSAGVPVVCFEAATGLAEYLQADPILSELVVPYYDLHAAANTIIEIANDVDKKRILSERSREYANQYFSMDSYVELIASCAQNPTAKIT